MTSSGRMVRSDGESRTDADEKYTCLRTIFPPTLCRPSNRNVARVPSPRCSTNDAPVGSAAAGYTSPDVCTCGIASGSDGGMVVVTAPRAIEFFSRHFLCTPDA